MKRSEDSGQELRRRSTERSAPTNKQSPANPKEGRVSQVERKHGPEIGAQPEEALAKLIYERAIFVVLYNLRQMGDVYPLSEHGCFNQVPTLTDRVSCLKRNGFELLVEVPRECYITVKWRTLPLKVQKSWDGTVRGTYIIGAAVALPLSKLAEDRFGEGGSTITFDFRDASNLPIKILTTASEDHWNELKWQEAYASFTGIPDLDSGGFHRSGNGYWLRSISVGPQGFGEDHRIAHARFMKVELFGDRESRNFRISVLKSVLAKCVSSRR